MKNEGTISFLPWVRQGIGSHIEEEDTLGEGDGTAKLRAWIEVTAEVEAKTVSKENDEDSARLTAPIKKKVQIMGPGDVVGIRHDAIMKTSPRPNTYKYASNLIAFVEFYEEDFPWRFTPARPKGDKLRPWLALIALKDEEYTLYQPTEELAYIKVASTAYQAAFHDHRTTWACAHVQANEFMDRAEEIGGKLEENPDIAFSRIICPRKLEDGAAYTAFLIPAFESGRLAGLGEAVDGEGSPLRAQKSSWIQPSDETSLNKHWHARPYEFPVYYQWRFQVDESGDFETLVDALKPFKFTEDTGQRLMDVAQEIPYLQPEIPTVESESALQATAFEPKEWKDDNFQRRLKELLNYSFPEKSEATEAISPPNPFFESNNEGGSNAVTEQTDDPFILPPVYGQWHHLATEVPEKPDDWLHQLNLDLRYRALAGAGARIVQENQEQFVERAWQQLGEAKTANENLRFARMACVINQFLESKHLSSLDDSRFLQVTSFMHKYVLDQQVNERKTILQQISESQLPVASINAAFQKMLRPSRKLYQQLLQRDTQLNLPSLNYSLLNGFLETGPNRIFAADIKSPPSIAVNLDDYLDDLNNLGFGTRSFSNSRSLNVSSNPTIDLREIRQTIAKRIDPMVSLKKRVTANIQILSSSPNNTGNQPQYKSKEQFSPYLVRPEYPDPVYHYVKKISKDLIIPNVAKIPDNSVLIMEPNLRFIEALMAGMNHEMARELLWREYPTDMRGTYFKTFWDRSDSDLAFPHDIRSMTDWKAALGENANAFGEEGSGMVLIVRGELLRKFPDTLIFAHKAKAEQKGSQYYRYLENDFLKNVGTQGNDRKKVRLPLFQAKLEPDIFLLAFDLSDHEAKGKRDPEDPGWYFVFQERPGELQLGLDHAEIDNSSSAHLDDKISVDGLAWNHVLESEPGPAKHINFSRELSIDHQVIKWGKDSNAAHVAYLLHQRPVTYARHGTEMIS